MTVNESSPDSNNYVLMPSKNPDEPTGMYMCTKHRVNGEYVDDETYNASLHNKDQQGGTTMLSTHTPAPWQVLPIVPDVPYIRVRGTMPGGRRKIANVPHHTWYPDISEVVAQHELEETIANANLIAAAPRLLKALEDLMSIELMVSQLTPKVIEHIAQARAAIAQAKGKLHV